MVIQFKDESGRWLASLGAEYWEEAKRRARKLGMSYRMVDSTGLVIREYHPCL